MNLPRLAAGLALLVVGGCSTYEAGEVRTSVADAGDGRIYFASADPYDFRDALDGDADRIVVHGDLSLPETSGGRVPAVVLVHGNGGVTGHQRDYAESLNDLGYAVFVVDSYTPRDVRSLTRAHVDVTEQMMLADAYAALRLLRTHDRIAPDRIGVVGWSKGGIVALFAMVDRLAGYLSANGERFAFAAAYYPYCGVELGADDRLAGPVLMLLGERDDYTPSATCVAMAESLTDRGEPIDHLVLPDAHHAFDRLGSRVGFGAWRVTIRDASPRCMLMVGPDGVTRTVDGRRDISSFFRRVDFLKTCAVKGAHAGGNAAAKSRAWRALVEFLHRQAPARRPA